MSLTLMLAAIVMDNESTTTAMTETVPLLPNNQDTGQQYRVIAIRRIIWKLDRRLIPFFVLIEIMSFLNRVSIGMYPCV